MSQFVDFKEVKQKVTMIQLLQYYEITFTKKDSEHINCDCFKQNCKNIIKVNIKKNMWFCFGCKKGGNILDFVSIYENITIRQGALKLVQYFNLQNKEQEEILRTDELGENSILEFTLKNLDQSDKFLTTNFKAETIKYFEAGFFSGRGVMQNKIAIPIHNMNSDLVAFIGRQKDGKYKYPKNFNPSFEIYNLHNLFEKEDFIFLVKTCLDVWRLYEAGIKNVVAIFFNEITEQQKILLIDKKIKNIWLVSYDKNFRQDNLLKLAGHFMVKSTMLEKEVWKLSNKEIENLL